MAKTRSRVLDNSINLSQRVKPTRRSKTLRNMFMGLFSNTKINPAPNSPVTPSITVNPFAGKRKTRGFRNKSRRLR